ncbi:MAG: YjjG family noncanonical pyrimidine nucleotidase, partial [Vicingaceae bacterium]|nr:YjjG family noncanonical pyrimidine nucleotidase [Vicingaceae bacterium]
ESFDRFIKKYREINKRYWNLYRQNLVTKEQVREGRFKDTLNFFNIENYNELSDELSHQYVTLGPTKTNLFPHTHDVLTRLNKQYEMHIITNGFVEVQHIKLQNSNLSKYFDVIVCSEETGKKKPHRDVFNLALEKAGTIPGESVMIGDSFEADIIGAQRSGMKAIWFNPNNEIAKKPVQEINCLSELSTIFKV